uniref:Uncharacterized protein n=1 Tax=Neogobius melanostomus TaxID=47308 RepID=A0A8C6T1U8_9GOBI
FEAVVLLWIIYIAYIVNVRKNVRLQGCANLTVVLDNWKYAIVTQVKDLLLNDHQEKTNSIHIRTTSLIQPLSEALGELYKEFNALKDRLVDLTSKFDSVEGFVDDIRRVVSPLLSPECTPSPQDRSQEERPHSLDNCDIIVENPVISVF